MAHKKKKSSSNALTAPQPGIWAGVDKSYRAEEDHRTLVRAGEVKGDRDRFKAAKDHHKKTQKHMEKACK
jgi:hypothetical protein